MTARGSCLCGAVRFAVAAPLGPVVACHCSQCRKISGHFAAAVPAPWDKITLEGDVRWFESSKKARRGFCPTCGSYLFWEEYDGLAYISAGVLEDGLGLQLAAHIFCADKGEYYAIADGLPCHPADRDTKGFAP